MARYTGPVCRLCRREGEKLFLKGNRCQTEKCAIASREQAPGEKTKFQRKLSGYGVRLREKQKARRMYGLMEKQFRVCFREAERAKGVTGLTLLQLLERRLDNVVFRMGFAVGRVQARQLVRHGHFLVNGKRLNVPSYSVKPGDEIQVKERSKNLQVIKESMELSAQREKPAWLQVDEAKLAGKVLRFPNRDEMPAIQDQLIVELYSK